MSIRGEVRNRWFNTSVCRGVEFGPSLVHPEFMDECDINKIMASYAVNRELPRPSPSAPRLKFADYASAPGGFFEAQLLLVGAASAWSELSLVVRERFRGPEEVLRFLAEPGNRAEAVRLGLVDGSSEGSAR